MAVGRRSFSAAFKAECVEMYRAGHSYAEVSREKDHAGHHPKPATVKIWVMAANKTTKRVEVASKKGEALAEIVDLANRRLVERLTAEKDTEKIMKVWDVATKRQLDFARVKGAAGAVVAEPEAGAAPEGPGVG